MRQFDPNPGPNPRRREITTADLRRTDAAMMDRQSDTTIVFGAVVFVIGVIVVIAWAVFGLLASFFTTPQDDCEAWFEAGAMSYEHCQVMSERDWSDL